MKITLMASGLWIATAVIASAVPSPVSGPLPGSGDGVNVRYVEFTPSVVHSVGDAVAALAYSPGHPNYVSEYNGVANNIDVADGDYLGEISPTHDAPPFPGGDPLFAVRFSGYLNIVTPGDYYFISFTDDGFRLTLGGEVVSIFDADRAPALSADGPIPLTAGLYPIEMIGWEQGGAFVNELSWTRPGDTFFSVVPKEVLFTSPGLGVPDAGATAGLLSGAMMLLVGLHRRFARGTK